MTKEAKHELFKVLDRLGSKLDITKTQYETAKKRYEAVGKWLASGEYCLTEGNKVCLRDGVIYLQGSIQLATTVKPIGQDEFDVDLVFFSPNISKYDIEPSELNRLIGDRLRENDDYRNMMDASPNNGRLKRGWRITYADEFHLDITPSINNHTEYNNSEYVPDRKIQDWKPSNPRDYAVWFNDSASKLPSWSFIFKDSINIAMESHKVTDFPEDEEMKPLLKRYVQILKRHRDEMFKEREQKPISIIITTLATHAYNECVKSKVYNNELDLLVDVIREMPNYIINDSGKYFILNPKTRYENFAERWNEVIAKKSAFDAWHENVLAFFESLYTISGTHNMFDALGRSFGKAQVSSVYEDMNSFVSQHREAGILGLGLSSSGILGNPMKKNTFFGN